MKKKLIYLLGVLLFMACSDDTPQEKEPFAIDDRSYEVTGLEENYSGTVGSYLVAVDQSIATIEGLKNLPYRLVVKGDRSATLTTMNVAHIFYFFDDSPCDIYLYTPYNELVEKAVRPLDVSQQSEDEKIDLRCAKARGVRKDDDITFNFFHALSRLKLNISIADDFEENRSSEELLEELEVSVEGYYTQADYLLATDEIMNYREIKKINMVVAEDGRVAEAILLPTKPMAEAQLLFKLREPETLFYYTINDLELLPTKEVVLDVLLKHNEVVFKDMRINDWLVVEQGSGTAE